VRVLVIGGTTFFGKLIVEELLKEGYQVWVFSRGNRRPAFFDQGVEHIRGDRTDRKGFQRKLGGRSFDVVIDNIAFTPEDVRSALETFRGNVGRYILTSSAAVYYTGSMTMPVPEGDVDFSFEPPKGEKDDPFWSYTLGKLRAEHELIEQDALPYTIIRPPIVLGPEDPSLRGYFYFQRLMDGEPLLVTNGGVQSFRLIYSRDLARGYLLALKSEQAVNQIYNLAQREVIRLVDLLKEAARILEVEPDIVGIPAEALARGGLEYPEPYARMTNFIPDIAKAEAELGFTTTPFRRWLSETVLWYRDAYRGEDSAGYEQRRREVEFAEHYRQALVGLTAKEAG